MNHTIASQLINVTKIYENSEIPALRNVAFHSTCGELVLLLGPSGSGKTTLLTTVAGMLKPTSGEILLFGRKVHDYSVNDLQKLRARHIGFIFQLFYLIESLTVLENIMLVMKFAGLDKTVAQHRALGLLQRFGIKDLAKALPSNLSQGEKQRVAVSRALANNAELIIADEPTGSLSSHQGLLIIELLRDIAKSEEKSVIVASHDERIARYADRIYCLHDGTIEIRK